MTPLSRSLHQRQRRISSSCCSKAGANPNTPIATGETPLMTCAEQRQRERRPDAGRARRRRQREGAVAEPDGADVGGGRASPGRGAGCSSSTAPTCRPTRRKGFTALHFAAREGDLESTRALLAAGVNINIRSQPEPVEPAPAEGRRTGRTASGAAAAGGGPRGPAYQATLSAGSTPLLVATVRGHVPLALFLLDHGADPNVGDAGFTPLHWAAGDLGRRRRRIRCTASPIR